MGVDGGTYCKCKANQLQSRIVKGLQNDFSSFNLFKRRTILCLTSNHTITISPSPHQHHHISITITISPSPQQHQHHQHHLHITILGHRCIAPNHFHHHLLVFSDADDGRRLFLLRNDAQLAMRCSILY